MNDAGSRFDVLYSNQADPTAPEAVALKLYGAVSISEVDGSRSLGPAATVKVSLRPMELQILGRG